MPESETTQPSRLARLTQLIKGWRPSAEASDPMRLGRWVVLVLAIYGSVVTGLGLYWSQTPDGFDTNQTAVHYAAAVEQDVVTGSVTVSTLREVIRTLLEKPGGYLLNDLFPPGVWLDNMPHWEYGALVQCRDLARALREVLSRSQSQSKEDVDLTLAEPRINFQSDSWI
ncbi:DUF2333 family protein, partial [Luminiphilus sp.]|nr:DUF2333 family protein [Luminiphilus sp.]